MNRLFARAYVWLVTIVSLGTLAYVAVAPLPSMRVTRDGVEHLSPPVINLDTGEPVDLGVLVRHFRGD